MARSLTEGPKMTLSSSLTRLLQSDAKGLIIGSVLLAIFFGVGAALVEGFASANNFRSILLLAAFLGLASLGQTLVAMVGGLDLSIPFVIGAANVLLAFLFGTDLPPALCIALIAIFGAAVGALNGALSFRLQGQALILTLGVGFAVVGAAQILVTLGANYSGAAFGQVPPWFSAIASINGRSFGLSIPPIVLIWAATAATVILAIHRTRAGRALYAVGGNRTAAARLSISEWRVWTGTYTLSGLAAATTGMLLLGFSGGGFVGVGDAYLFTTVAAVVVGGTSLLGGSGGYGATIIGVLVLQVLTSLLVGLGLNYAAQQTVFGLLILPMVALYARAPHVRLQV